MLWRQFHFFLLKWVVHLYFRAASALSRIPSARSQIISNNRANSRLSSQIPAAYQNNLPNYIFELQLLIEPDRHVFQSIEKALTDLTHPSALLHSCQFFNSVLINDFPPEIFLQRPRIVYVSYYWVFNCFEIKVFAFRNFILCLTVDLLE